ncbi:MAG: DUF3429 domain-containing protein [Cellvibrionaceae bacterium]|nr:DUF3429 domain-containing protein [Cellvibrionaceae bacterium]
MNTAPLDQHQTIITHYTYLGLLPFFAGAVGPWLAPDLRYVFIDFVLLYAAIILAFLAGTLWCVALLGAVQPQRRQIHAAIVFSLWPLISHLLAYGNQIGAMLMGFLLLLFWEKCFINSLYPQWYQQLRHRVSFIVAACLMLLFFNLLSR